ncbi:hypothetical protein [Streptomyces fildesensis]|uniref:hypothetical protein n=1 Tax=Streptomyces fildesensis TaxID=375757 RepID=UPI0018E042E7|nr:hypothetical protein [Streptomyces fildesensis]
MDHTPSSPVAETAPGAAQPLPARAPGHTLSRRNLLRAASGWEAFLHRSANANGGQRDGGDAA